MNETHIIAASRDGKETELWIAPGSAEQALVRVREHLPAGWMVTLTGNSLTRKQAAVLALGPDEVRKLREAS
jgi:hypothetical protein